MSCNSSFRHSFNPHKHTHTHTHTHTHMHAHATCVPNSFPVTVCWNVQPANSSNNLVRSSPSSRCSGWSTDLSKTCHNISENYPCPSYGMSFSDKGQYQLQAEFTNRVSCVRETYTFRVVAGETHWAWQYNVILLCMYNVYVHMMYRITKNKNLISWKYIVFFMNN